ncbi:hypothetical protein OPIT5_16050 [Opitutaceae bacterium TAV5]|nr:hypothetical protein OPIT5_16050 [Opitutaceae bacterium TAV5]
MRGRVQRIVGFHRRQRHTKPRYLPGVMSNSLFGPDTAFEWRGFEGREGIVDGRALKVVAPRTPLPGRPWAWRPEFFDAFADADEQLVARGFHLVYLNVVDHYGCPKAIAHGDAAYRFLTDSTLPDGFRLAPRFAFIALSRAGLFAYNYAITFPERVACIYADNPVCDFKSWPAGFGVGPGSAGDWQKCLAIYSFADEAQARAYSGNPVDRIDVIARARIPVLQVIGDADETVPVSENALRIAAALRAAGSPYEEIVKPGGLHHPHGLPGNPGPIVEFVMRHTVSVLS